MTNITKNKWRGLARYLALVFFIWSITLLVASLMLVHAQEVAISDPALSSAI
jgi:hypothetical protein